MSSIAIGILAGLIFGVVDVLLMIPLDLPEKKVAMLGAFASRFAIGFLIANTKLPLPMWAVGLLIGVLISLPDAIITKTYIPIIVVGAVGGMIIGFVVGKWFVRV